MGADESEPVERSADGRYIVVDGRRWRASDPQIPPRLRAELVQELMRGRRLVRSRGSDARTFVQDAKVALGERGEPWWEEPSEDGRRDRLAATIRALLRHREGATICPSDAARVVGGERWRQVTPIAREVAAGLADAEVVQVHQKGERVDPRTARGPIRIAAGPGLTR